MGKRHGDDLENCRIAKLQRCYVDSNRNGCVPGRSGLAGGTQNPFADGDDQARLLGKRDEFRRGNKPAFRILPAQQRLETDNFG